MEGDRLAMQFDTLVLVSLEAKMAAVSAQVALRVVKSRDCIFGDQLSVIRFEF
jgi:hypothetical protein